MVFDAEVLAKLGAPILSVVVAAVVKHYTEGRSRIVSFIGHVSAFTLQDEARTVVHTHSVVIRNTGSKTANNVRLAHAILPPNLTVFPAIQYTIERNPEGAAEILIPAMVPKEQVTISYLYFPPLIWSQINSSLKSDEGFGKVITVIPTPQPNKIVIAAVIALMFIGGSFCFYWLIKFLMTLV